MKVWMYLLDYDESWSRDDPVFEKFYGSIASYVDGLVHYSPDGSITRVLYAMTNEKKLAKMFEAVHDMELFTKITEKMAVEEYEELANEDAYKLAILEDCELNMRDDRLYSKKFPVKHIIMTGLEKNVMDDVDESTDLAFTTDLILPPFQCINQQYIPALDALLYCTAWAIQSGSEDIEDEASYGWSFNTTYMGYAHNQLRLILNVFEIYTDYFEYILLK